MSIFFVAMQTSLPLGRMGVYCAHEAGMSVMLHRSSSLQAPAFPVIRRHKIK